MPNIAKEPGDTEKQTFDRSLFCGELERMNFRSAERAPRCGARDEEELHIIRFCMNRALESI